MCGTVTHTLVPGALWLEAAGAAGYGAPIAANSGVGPDLTLRKSASSGDVSSGASFWGPSSPGETWKELGARASHPGGHATHP